MYKLSVIIPIYNAANYLKECLDSIIVNNKSIEYILIDDGSNDDSLKICKLYKNMKNVVIVQNSNHGVSYTRNYGISISRGEYIMFVDADDYVISNWHEIIIKEFNFDNDITIFSKNYNNILYTKQDLIESCLGLNHSKLKNCYLMTSWSKIYKKDFLKKNSISFVEDLINGEDMLFNLQVILNTDKIKIVSSNFYIYRINNYSATNTFNTEIIFSDMQFQYKLKETLSFYCVGNQLEYFCTFSELMGIYIILQRICFSKSKKKKKRMCDLFESRKNILFSKINIVNNEFSFREKLILTLFLKKKYWFIIIILCLKNKIKLLFSKKQVIKLIEI